MGYPYVAQADLKLLAIILPHLLKCWDYRYRSSHTGWELSEALSGRMMTHAFNPSTPDVEAGRVL